MSSTCTISGEGPARRMTSSRGLVVVRPPCGTVGERSRTGGDDPGNGAGLTEPMLVPGLSADHEDVAGGAAHDAGRHGAEAEPVPEPAVAAPDDDRRVAVAVGGRADGVG